MRAAQGQKAAIYSLATLQVDLGQFSNPDSVFSSVKWGYKQGLPKVPSNSGEEEVGGLSRVAMWVPAFGKEWDPPLASESAHWEMGNHGVLTPHRAWSILYTYKWCPGLPQESEILR